MMLLAIPLTFVILVFHLLSWRSSEKSKNDIPTTRWWVKILVVILIIAMGLAPLAGLSITSVGCFKIHAWLAQPIIEAINTYQANNGEYPSDLEALVPEYLESIPKPLCLYLNPLFWGYSASARHYGLEWCPTWEVKEYPIIALNNIAGGFPQRYNLRTAEWSHISGFDDIYEF